MSVFAANEIGRRNFAPARGIFLIKTVVVCPLTTSLHPAWRSRLQVEVAGKRAEVAADQIRSVAKQRLGDKLGSLSKTEARALRDLLGEMYG